MSRAAWNPLGGRFDLNRVRDLGTQEPFPASGIEESQGSPYPLDIQRDLAVPQQGGINWGLYQNPFKSTMFVFPAPDATVSGTVAKIAVPANVKRVYLLLQNQGPGNIFINFGTQATAASATANANCMQLIPTQIYEQIGGGYLDPMTAFSVPLAFCSPEYVSIIADQPGTTILVFEGVYQPSIVAGY